MQEQLWNYECLALLMHDDLRKTFHLVFQEGYFSPRNPAGERYGASETRLLLCLIPSHPQHVGRQTCQTTQIPNIADATSSSTTRSMRVLLQRLRRNSQAVLAVCADLLEDFVLRENEECIEKQCLALSCVWEMLWLQHFISILHRITFQHQRKVAFR